MRQRFVSGVDFFLFFYVVDSNFISFLFFFFCSSVVDSAFLFFSFLFQLCDALERSRQTKAPTVFLLFFVSVSKLFFFFNNFFFIETISRSLSLRFVVNFTAIANRPKRTIDCSRSSFVFFLFFYRVQRRTTWNRVIFLMMFSGIFLPSFIPRVTFEFNSFRFDCVPSVASFLHCLLIRKGFA